MYAACMAGLFSSGASLWQNIWSGAKRVHVLCSLAGELLVPCMNTLVVAGSVTGVTSSMAVVAAAHLMRAHADVANISVGHLARRIGW